MRTKESTEHSFTRILQVYKLFNYETKKGKYDSVSSMSTREKKGKREVWKSPTKLFLRLSHKAPLKHLI